MAIPLVNRVSKSDFNARLGADMAAGATFQGVSEDVSGYGRAGISIKSDNKANGTLTIETSHDGDTWGGPSRTWKDTRFSQPHMWNIVEKYFRIKYVNGTQAATNLSIQVQYSVNANILLGHQINEVLIDETEAVVTRSVIVGRDSNGNYANVPVDSKGRLKVEQEENETTRVLKEILRELKIINEYNALTHETTITKEGV